MPDPGPIKYVGGRPVSTGPNLVLARRRVTTTHSPFEVSEASVAARASIKAIVSATRAPFASATGAEAEKVAGLERSLRQLELILAERERALNESEARMAERERDLAETEALLQARERLLAASRKPAPVKAVISEEERAALEQLRAELERQEEAVKEAKQALREREQFLDESETKLFEKVQAQQEKEIEQEQRDEDLRARERRIREREAALDPQAAAQLKAEDEATQPRDEFKE